MIFLHVSDRPSRGLIPVDNGWPMRLPASSANMLVCSISAALGTAWEGCWHAMPLVRRPAYFGNVENRRSLDIISLHLPSIHSSRRSLYLVILHAARLSLYIHGDIKSTYMYWSSYKSRQAVNSTFTGNFHLHHAHSTKSIKPDIMAQNYRIA